MFYAQGWLIYAVLLDGILAFSIRNHLFPQQEQGTNELDIELSNNNQDYMIKVNNQNWLYSAPTELRNNGEWANIQINSTFINNGTDHLGKYSEFVIEYIDLNDNNQQKKICFQTSFKQYVSNRNIIIFTQSFPNDITKTNVKDYDSVISSFPSFVLLNGSSNLGYVHWSGGMAGYQVEYGSFNFKSSSSLKGGIPNSGPLALFDINLTNCIVISPLTNVMTLNDEVINNGSHKLLRYGVQGGVTNINNGFNASWIMTLTPFGGGPNSGMRYWGDLYLKYYNKPRGAHSRDFTLQHLGYGTDNGAYYFYYPIPNMTYADTLIEIKKNHNKLGIKSKWVQLDQWYYNQTWPGLDCHKSNCHDYNFTANLTLFPDGIMPVYNETGWYFLAQTDPWSYDNVYCRDLGFECMYNETVWAAIPASDKFYDYLFSINNKQTWGLVGFERDWLSYITTNFEVIHNNTDFAVNWMKGMGKAAEKYDIGGVQLCMSYPRHILSSASSPSFTQARVSGDYHPGSGQWKIGVGAIFVSAIDIQPSKDTWWSNNTLQTTGMRGRCSNGCREPHNRLQSLIVALSNGPNYSSDRIGYENAELIMMCCNQNGLLLRPDVSATAMDSVILQRTRLINNGVEGELYSSMSFIDNEYMYYYIFAQISRDYKLYLNELSFYSSNNTMVTDNYFVYETNTTNKFMEFNDNTPLYISNASEYDFEFFTIIPIDKGYNIDQWYLMGELNKWIKVSSQRFDKITLYNNGSIAVDINGAQYENVSIGFVNGKTKQQQTIIYNITQPSGKATVYFP